MKACIGILGWCCFWPVWGIAQPHALFSGEQSLQRRLVQEVEGARSSIDLAVYQVSSIPLLRALRHAEERGVNVRILVDGGPRSRPAPQVREAFPGRLRWVRARRGQGSMHHKFVLFDGEKVVTGSYNWTPGAEYVNEENMVILDDPEVVSGFRREFGRLWSRSAPVTESEWRINLDEFRLRGVEKNAHQPKRRNRHVRSRSK